MPRTLLLGLLLMFACACAPLPEADYASGVQVVNETDVLLDFRLLKQDGEWLELSEVRPGYTVQLIGTQMQGEHSLIAKDGCTTGPLVAIDAAGREVARHEPGLCVGDSWVVDS